MAGAWTARGNDHQRVTLAREHDLNAPRGVAGRNSDNTLIEKVFAWEPSTRLRDGLEKTYHWIQKQMTSGKAESGARATALAR